MALAKTSAFPSPFFLVYCWEGAQHYCFRAVDSIDSVHNCIQSLHFFKLLSIIVEEVKLLGRVGTNVHNYDTCFLVVIALLVDVLQNF